MPQQVSQLLSTLAPNLDLVLVAVIVGEIKRSQGWMRNDRLEELNRALSLNVVATKAEMDQSLVVTL